MLSEGVGADDPSVMDLWFVVWMVEFGSRLLLCRFEVGVVSNVCSRLLLLFGILCLASS